MNWASTRDNLSSGFAKNKGADQPKLVTGGSSIFSLVAVTGETGLSLALSETPETGFVATRPVNYNYMVQIT